MILRCLGALRVGGRREESFVIAILKFCLFIKSSQLCVEALAGLLFASDVLCHLEVGWGFFVV